MATADIARKAALVRLAAGRLLRAARHCPNWIERHSGAVTAVATIVIAVLTGVYAHYASAQWREMKRLSELTQDALIETKKNNSASAKSTDDALRITRDQLTAFQVVEGAHLGVALPVLLGDRVALPIENYGRIPSPKVSIFAHVYRFQSKDRTSLYSKRHEFGGDRTEIPPGVGKYGVTVPLELKANEMDRIANGEIGLWVGVTLKYDNGFGTQSQPGFCFSYAGTKWDACPVAHFADLERMTPKK
ncbi:MAG: hypothetical protein DMD96_01025 [Candidatus Rokuibacteriota bacterium]|nr:MAG: hypothetical protein DMD96_01025 [Candidatus Rokubacteria bacterium]